MAYFSSGAEGMDWESENCDRCRHQDGPEGDSHCAVFLLQMLHNYDQFGETPAGVAYAECLSTLIPRTQDGLGNERCLMFIAKE